MRKLTKILSIIMLLVLLTAETCSDSGVVVSKEDRLAATFQDIENKFEEDELSDDILSAFEKRAIQKLKDIFDYINIYADTSLSIRFREQAKHMIQENFFEKKDVEIFYNNLEILEDSVNTTLYYSKNGQTFKTEISSIEITNHFLKKSDLTYSGEIQFTPRIEVINSSNSVDSVNFQSRIKFLAVKTKKHFGNETAEVWELYLTEAKLLPQI